MNYLYIFGLINLVWLVILTLFVFKIKRHYNRLTTRTKRYSIDDILDKLLSNEEKLEASQKDLYKMIQETDSNQKRSFQKIGHIRYNPFERGGGDQSFVVALLDSMNSGLVINFLYTREGMRVYTKRILKGQSSGLELSAEEQSAIKKAS